MSVFGKPGADLRILMASRHWRIAVVTGEPVKCQLQHHLGRTRRPGPLALDTFQAFEKAADVEQHAGKFRSDTVERMTDALACGDNSFGESAGTLAAAGTGLKGHTRV